ncbi:MAG: SUMF1/EgtB/PvdO family nonheme iron enzyme, partial [Vulcanimicrobiaceae bacterium]
VDFAWDNERDAHTVACKEFWMQRYAVSNGDWLAFVAQGGPVPHFWERRGNSWMLRCTYESIPLPLSWPVYVTQRQASSYAAFYSMRLPSEAEFHRAAYGDSQKQYPWGDEPPTQQHANLNFRRNDPEGVDAHPLSASEFGIEGLVGNGWEWTSTPFEPFDGFTPMPTYPQYSADFFDGEHFVCKGASPITDTALVRPSFRNWFYADYPYAYVKFRCVAA